MKVSERNNDARYFVNAKLGHVSTMSDTDFPEFDGGSRINKLLTDLIEVTTKGFRGVVLTAIVGMKLNESYDPLNRFYDCNPRAIFEDGIWYALSENGVPCGKSDPLNVAKNIYELNESWAEGRRPRTAALAAVYFLREVIASPADKRERLIDYFFFRLLRYSREVAAIEVSVREDQGDPRQALAHRLVYFSLAHPESGMIPQTIVAKLLSKVFELSDIEVAGGDASVFGTNTTSKKPADVWTQIGEEPLCLFEVTVKPVTAKRLIDCIDALRSVDQATKPVTFVCRIPEDVLELTLVDGKTIFRGKCFEFIDFRHFVTSVASLLRPEQMAEVVADVQRIVADVNVSVTTKNGWNRIFG